MTQISLLITRPQASAESFIASLARDVQSGTRIVLSPLIEIVPIAVTVDADPYEAVIFTSSNAVELGPDGDGKTAYCVGETTAQRAESMGWRVAGVLRNAEAMIEFIKKATVKPPLLHLAGRHRRGEIAEKLTALGIRTDVETLYDQRLINLSNEARTLLKGDTRIVVPLFSPRTATHFLDQVPEMHNVIILAISDTVADLFQGSDALKIMVADAPTGQEMLGSLEKVLRDASLA